MKRMITEVKRPICASYIAVELVVGIVVVVVAFSAL